MCHLYVLFIVKRISIHYFDSILFVVYGVYLLWDLSPNRELCQSVSNRLWILAVGSRKNELWRNWTRLSTRNKSRQPSVRISISLCYKCLEECHTRSLRIQPHNSRYYYHNSSVLFLFAEMFKIFFEVNAELAMAVFKLWIILFNRLNQNHVN